MGETPVPRQTRGSNAYGVHVPISVPLPRREAPDLPAARVGAFRRSRRARGIDHEVEISRALLQRFAYPFGIEGKISTRRLGDLR
jgi:hypothetical protein